MQGKSKRWAKKVHLMALESKMSFYITDINIRIFLEHHNTYFQNFLLK